MSTIIRKIFTGGGKILVMLLSLPKTIIFNLKYLPLRQAIHLPILVHWNSRYRGNGRIILDSLSFAAVKLGFVDPTFPSKQFVFVLTGSLQFKGKASIGTGCEMVIRGELVIGDNFSCSGGTKIDAKSKSSFGDDVLIGHHCAFIDDDGHDLLVEDIKVNYPKGYHIGNHVWFGRDCLVLKGTSTADNIIFGARSVITGHFTESSVVYAGTPIQIVKRNISWKH